MEYGPLRTVSPAPDAAADSVEAFIQRWTTREGWAERANYQMFLSELCDVLGVARPERSGNERDQNDYVFERAVRPRGSDGTTAPKRIDLYKRNAFILEAKQSRLPGKKNALSGQMSLLGVEPEQMGNRSIARGWDVMMQNARKQAEGYVFLLDANHAAPPFIIVCDVGHCLEIYADFTGTGRAYNQFPDRNGFRIYLEDLRRPEIRDLLAQIWRDPHALDPSKTSARVTRDIAKRLAQVSKALEELKAGGALTPDEERIKDEGLVLILKELHERLDRLVFEAYGWPADLSDEAILERLVALNAERAKEEAAGHVRRLRPDYQIPRFAKGAAAKSGELDLGANVVAIDRALPDFPKDRYEQPLAVEALLMAANRPMDATELARGFKRGGKRIEQRVAQCLSGLALYGRITPPDDGRYAARKAA